MPCRWHFGLCACTPKPVLLLLLELIFMKSQLGEIERRSRQHFLHLCCLEGTKKKTLFVFRSSEHRRKKKVGAQKIFQSLRIFLDVYFSKKYGISLFHYTILLEPLFSLVLTNFVIHLCLFYSTVKPPVINLEITIRLCKSSLLLLYE